MPVELAQLACTALLYRTPATVRPLPRNETPGSSPVLRVKIAGGPYVVVKLYHGHRQVRAYRHARVIAAVSAHAVVATSAVLACGALPGSDVTALVITDLGGFDLNLAIHNGMLRRERALVAMGRLLSQLHGLPNDALDRRFGEGPRIEADPLIAHGRDVVDSVAISVVRRAVEAARPGDGRVWCHGDLHPGNVLVDRPTGRLSVVDLEDMVHAAPEYDLAQCLATSDALSPKDRAAVIAGYGRPISTAVLDDLIVYQAVRGLVHAAGSEHRDQHLWRDRVDYALRHCLHP